MIPHVAKETADRLSLSMRRMLVAHVAGDGRLAVARVHDYENARQTRLALMARGLARWGNPQAVRPDETKLTTDGRQVAAVVLAEYAEALIATGHLKADAVSISLRAA